ncbi:MAG: ABC transporter permease [Candidatus Vogelbacteria bacterium]|nr:ABC transporter permease [Candidatus Vogelbacteria bacterium]
MFFKKLRRVIKAGFTNFWRNGVVSLASVFVMVIALAVIGSLMLSSTVFSSIIADVKAKVDVNVYMKTDAPEADILSLKKSVEVLPEVKSVEYLSRADALGQFKERHKDNNLIIGALDELGENPLGAVLNIKAKDPSQYESIAKFLSADESALASGQKTIIDKVNFYQNKLVIDRLTNILSALERLGFALIILLIIIAILVTVNTVRVTIYSAREEISVMKLVGASNNYTRGPFIMEGIISGGLGAIITTVLFYPLVAWFSEIASGFLGMSLIDYYSANILQLFITLLLFGIIIGAFASLIAVHRYLKV